MDFLFLCFGFFSVLAVHLFRIQPFFGFPFALFVVESVPILFPCLFHRCSVLSCLFMFFTISLGGMGKQNTSFELPRFKFICRNGYKKNISRLKFWPSQICADKCHETILLRIQKIKCHTNGQHSSKTHLGPDRARKPRSWDICTRRQSPAGLAAI